MDYKILEWDPHLKYFSYDIELRMQRYWSKKEELVGKDGSLLDFANGYAYFGFHKTDAGWYYREWAPGAKAVYLTGDMVNWQWLALPLNPIGNGVFEIFLPGTDALYHGCLVKTVVQTDAGLLERVPLYARRAVQDERTGIWCGEIVDEAPYAWENPDFKANKKDLYIYECHIGMSQDREGIGSYDEFREKILPRIAALGYNTLQIMAIMEHPYYGSFGYQVSSFFAASSRYGTPRQLKALIDAAHGMGIAVLLDVVHSHAVKNVGEGLNEFDGTSYQFFHEGERGEHPTWGTKLFDYGKNEVIHFLLSNLKFWMTEYHFDGFRFDGVTSMIYRDHGLGTSFGDYGKYFSPNTDVEAITYLQLANELIRQVNPYAITVAEDMSAMPGMCLPICEGGVGFDCRLAMGEPDLWIKLVREVPDADWDMWQIWGELSGRRPGEKYIGYVESHDQALVGDKTMIFRLCDSRMYTDMSVDSQDATVARGMALHKMIRMITMSAGGDGYLNFMGNEFGHPEWIDFPREGNGWSYFYCRRQWHLAEDPNLKYQYLQAFDREMIHLLRNRYLLRRDLRCLEIDQNAKILVYARGDYVFAMNFHPDASREGYWLTVPEEGDYRVCLSTDEARFGGCDRISKTYVYRASRHADGKCKLQIYLPARTGLCLRRIQKRNTK